MGQKSQSSPTLGELEVKVLECLWSNQDGTAKEVHGQLAKIHSASVNTIQSAMERLFRKGLLTRVKKSHSYRYSAVVSKEELLGNLINDLVERFQTDSHSSAAAILNAAEQINEETLDLLEAEIRRRREGRQS